MSRFIDIAGQKFGKLSVIKLHPEKIKDNRTAWICLCDCGNTCIVTQKYIKKSPAPSCGNCLLNGSKICAGCFENKSFSEYHSCSSNTSGINSRCKSCVRKWYEANKERIRDIYLVKMADPKYKAKKYSSNKKSRVRNKNQQREYKLKYDKSHEVRERKKEQHRIRKQTDPQYNIKRRLRWRLRDALKKAVRIGVKHRSSLILLGCDMDFFKKYIEDKFYDEMSWDNMETWHLDHIKPCSKFDLTKLEDQKICFNYRNIQPLLEIDNLTKSYIYHPSR